RSPGTRLGAAVASRAFALEGHGSGPFVRPLRGYGLGARYLTPAPRSSGARGSTAGVPANGVGEEGVREERGTGLGPKSFQQAEGPLHSRRGNRRVIGLAVLTVEAVVDAGIPEYLHVAFARESLLDTVDDGLRNEPVGAAEVKHQRTGKARA